MGSIKDKFDAFDWETIVIDGHDLEQLSNIINNKNGAKNKPIAIIGNTIKGKGISFMENDNAWHGKVLDKQNYDLAMNELNKDK